MKLDLIFPVLPPALDGIGDYTMHLARALSGRHEVRILTAQTDACSLDETGVQVEQVFSTSPRSDVYNIVDPVVDRDPDWMVLQYNPFSYGRWGLNLSLPKAIRAIAEAAPNVKIALMVHEPFVPIENWRFAIFTIWQRWQLWQLGQAADVIFFSIGPWVQQFESWFPTTPLVHLPVGSNIPRAPSERTPARSTHGISDSTLVCGIFGSAHESRNLSLIRDALDALSRQQADFYALYIGSSGDVFQSTLDGLPLIVAGPLPSEDVSYHFQAMDLYLAPFRDGVSTRRGSFMVGLQHGVPSVTTLGPDTDDMLRKPAGSAFLASECGDASAYTDRVLELAEAQEKRQRLGTAGAALYNACFDWPHVAERLVQTFQEGAPSSSKPLRSTASLSSLQ